FDQRSRRSAALFACGGNCSLSHTVKACHEPADKGTATVRRAIQAMRASRFEFGAFHNLPDFWAFSDVLLAQSCSRIAEAQASDVPRSVRSEALRLGLLWRDVRHSTCDTRT